MPTLTVRHYNFSKVLTAADISINGNSVNADTHAVVVSANSYATIEVSDPNRKTYSKRVRIFSDDVTYRVQTPHTSDTGLPTEGILNLIQKQQVDGTYLKGYKGYHGTTLPANKRFAVYDFLTFNESGVPPINSSPLEEANPSQGLDATYQNLVVAEVDENGSLEAIDFSVFPNLKALFSVEEPMQYNVASLISAPSILEMTASGKATNVEVDGVSEVAFFSSEPYVASGNPDDLEFEAVPSQNSCGTVCFTDNSFYDGLRPGFNLDDYESGVRLIFLEPTTWNALYPNKKQLIVLSSYNPTIPFSTAFTNYNNVSTSVSIATPSAADVNVGYTSCKNIDSLKSSVQLSSNGDWKAYLITLPLFEEGAFYNNGDMFVARPNSASPYELYYVLSTLSYSSYADVLAHSIGSGRTLLKLDFTAPLNTFLVRLGRSQDRSKYFAEADFSLACQSASGKLEVDVTATKSCPNAEINITYSWTNALAVSLFVAYKRLVVTDINGNVILDSTTQTEIENVPDGVNNIKFYYAFAISFTYVYSQGEYIYHGGKFYYVKNDNTVILNESQLLDTNDFTEVTSSAVGYVESNFLSLCIATACYEEKLNKSICKQCNCENTICKDKNYIDTINMSLLALQVYLEDDLFSDDTKELIKDNLSIVEEICCKC